MPGICQEWSNCLSTLCTVMSMPELYLHCSSFFVGIAQGNVLNGSFYFVFLKALLREGALTIFPFKRLFKGKMVKC